MNKIIKENQNGFTLIEVLIAMTVFAFGILGIAAMQLSAINGNSYSSHLSEATTFTQSKIEQFISLAYDNPDLNDGNHIEPNPPNGVTGVQYAISWNSIDNAPISSKSISVTTTWSEKGVQKTVVMDYIKHN